MKRIGLAFKTFFAILFDVERAKQVSSLPGPHTTPSEPAARPAPVSQPLAPPRPERSEALTLLETLQREARLIDFLQEELDGFSDAQVGAAVREVHRNCGDVLKRLFEIGPLVNHAEGTEYEVTEADDAARIRLTGKVAGTRPVRGVLVHTGWRAGKCDLPKWTGSSDNEPVIAPAEVEIQ